MQMHGDRKSSELKKQIKFEKIEIVSLYQIAEFYAAKNYCPKGN